MSFKYRTEDPDIIRSSNGYSALSAQPNTIILDVATLALYLIDDTFEHSIDAYSLKALEQCLKQRMPNIIKGKDYFVNTGSLTLSVSIDVMEKLKSLPTVPQGESILQRETFPGQVVPYNQILKFFGVSRGMSHDTLRWIFYKGFSKLFSPENFPRLVPSPIGLYKGSVELTPYYQNLPGGFFLCDDLVAAVIEVTREQLINDAHALARFDANVGDIQNSLYLSSSNEQPSDTFESTEVDGKPTYSQNEFFQYLSETHKLSLPDEDQEMYWYVLGVRHQSWFQKGDTENLLLSHRKLLAAKLVVEALSTRK